MSSDRVSRMIMSVGLGIMLGAMLGGCPKPALPTAGFTASPRTGTVPLEVAFSDQSSAGGAEITEWSWQLGDGHTSNDSNPVHIYTVPGTYTVSLTVTTAAGGNTRTETGYIVASPANGQELFVEVPDPLSGSNPVFPLSSASAPAPGQSVPDSDFGLSQTRVTQGTRIRHEYSRVDPFNRNQSMILLTDLDNGQWLVYRTNTLPYNTAAQLVTTPELSEPRWDPVDSDLIWGLSATDHEFRLLRIDMNNPGEMEVVKDFAADPAIQPILTANPDLYRITMKDEGESSADKRYWAFILQSNVDNASESYRAKYIFTWDRQTDQVLGVYSIPLSESDIDWVGMSVNGNWVLIGGMDTNTGNLAGLTMADRALTQFHRLDYSTAHADVALDSDGNEVVVMQNANTDYVDMIPLEMATKPILESGGSYAGTNRVPLIRLYYASEEPDGLNSGVHISCNTPGYCVVSTTIASGDPAQNWLDRKIVLVKLDRTNPRVFYLAKVYGSVDDYWEETHATISNDGTKLVWNTNWGLNPGQAQVWTMQLSMPAGWRSVLGD
ncbi:MAG TPA: PKD domain-containing protein [Candidatus Hydrogenedentes bacterium]|nr:PKD domain-containing protein [Candidatus Hydrogenedentota bacterium]